MKNIKNTVLLEEDLENLHYCRDCEFYRADCWACVRKASEDPVEKMPWEAACEFYWD